MYLSCLEIDAGGIAGKNWLSNPYRIHQRLLMAFQDGAAGRVLFRLEQDRSSVRILVQSPIEGDWERGFQNLPILLRAEQKEVELSVDAGQRLRFLLCANPTARRGLQEREGKGPSGARTGLLREEDQRDWLRRKGEAGGFIPVVFEVRPCGFRTSYRTAGGKQARMNHLCVDFEGLLQVTEPELFLQTVESGIGSGKGFGFGMLSLARG